MFQSLTEKFERVFAKIRSRGKLSEEDVRETAKEVRRALLEADVNFRVVKDFVARIEARLIGEEVHKSFTPEQQIVRVVNEEMTTLLGGSVAPFHLKRPTSVVMVVGLQGSGKTTFCAKLAAMLRKRGRKPLLVGLDVYRPAAMDQLEILGKQINVPVARAENGETDVLALWRRAQEIGIQKLCDTLILDTAGRLHVDQEMMAEIESLSKAADPEETLLVLDSMTGQEAVNVATAFKERVQVSGIVLTKLDGDARGGAALSVRAVTGVPIRFAGTGEKLSDLEPFYPERMASRILGMGDVMSLIEKTQQNLDVAEAQALEKKVRSQSFDMEDFLGEIRRIKKMGPLDDMLKMIPGASRMIPQGATVDPKHIKRVEAIICSMTPEERARPHLLDGSRRKRIAKGSGTQVQDVNALLKQFEEMKKMMKMVGNLQKRKKGRRLGF
ncbi:MAG TPA: signal recognition particle protein [Candidatus Krumholzibacteria bacterium]|nr:signal recognition particle protein [Candidatus Krumholzibacteria bacterium]